MTIFGVENERAGHAWETMLEAAWTDRLHDPDGVVGRLEALTVPPADDRAEGARAVALNVMRAYRARLRGDFRAAESAAEAALEGLATMDKASRWRLRWEARAREVAGLAALRRGDNATARAHYEAEFAVARKLAEPGVEANARVHLGMIEGAQGDFLAAMAQFEEALKLLEQAPNRDLEGTIFANRGKVLLHVGNLPAAMEAFLAALERIEEVGDLSRRALTLSALGVVFRQLGDHDAARDSNEKGLINARFCGDRGTEIACLANLAPLAVEKEQPEEALRVIDEAEAMAETSGYGNAARHFRALRGQALAKKGDTATAVTTFVALARDYQQAGAAREVCEALLNVVAILEADPAAATAVTPDEVAALTGTRPTADSEVVPTLLGWAANEVEQRGFTQFAARVHELQADAAEQAGDAAAAIQHLRAALKARDHYEGGQARDEARRNYLAYEIDRARREIEGERRQKDELAIANRRLEELLREQREFLGIVSHDLKNPLSAVHVLAEVLAEDAKAVGDDDVVEMAEDILRSTEAMFSLVKNLIDAYRTEEGRIEVHPEPCSLVELIDVCVQSQQRAMQDKEIALERDDEPGVTITTDRAMLLQCIGNLLSNAVKFSPPGSEVRLSSGREDDTTAFIAVADSGPGLTAEDRKKLFQRFARLSAQPTGGEASTGLGLAIVKRFLDLLGGRIEVVSEPGAGVTFRAVLPMQETPVAPRG